MKKSRWKILIASLIIVFLVALIGSFLTTPAVKSDWYANIKPAITPPSYIFPIAWSILFFLIALSLFYAWSNSNKSEKNKIIIVFGINFLFNILWSFLYFTLRNPTIAFIEIIFLWFSILFMILALWKINKTASYLLIPYLLWVSFASVLNWLSIL